MSQGRFNINEILSQTAGIPKSEKKVEGNQDRIPFEALCTLFEKQFEEEFEKESENERKKLLTLRHNAVIGAPDAVTMVMEKIQTFLNKTNVKAVDLPEYYQGLAPFADEEQQKYNELTHAIYHEVFGLGPLAYWRKFPDSYAAQIIGTRIFLHIDGLKRVMPFQFKSIDHVYRILNSLTFHNEKIRISRSEPKAETDLFTGERVTVKIPPLVRNPVLTFRRFLIKFVTLEMEVQKGLFPPELINVVRGISKTHCNVVVAGPPGTGKSTFIKALLHERSEYLTTAILEKHYELAADRDYPDRAIVSMIADEKNFHHAIEDILRTDIDYGIVGEIRRVEVEGFLLLCERLLKGAITSFHIFNVLELAPQWARLILDQFPTRNFEIEMGRVASQVDLVFELRQSEDKLQKTLHSIQELRYDSFTGEISTHYLVRHDPERNIWEYDDQISEQLLKEMNEKDSYWAAQVKDGLQKLMKQSPISKGGTIYFNPIKKQPLHRIADLFERWFKRSEQL